MGEMREKPDFLDVVMEQELRKIARARARERERERFQSYEKEREIHERIERSERCERCVGHRRDE